MTGGAWLVSFYVLCAVIAALGLLVLSGLRNMGAIYDSLSLLPGNVGSRASSLTAGQLAPEITWQALDGSLVCLADLGGVRREITFVSPSCRPCVAVMQELAASSKSSAVVVSFGDVGSTLELARSTGVDESMMVLLVDPTGAARHRWGISATPTTVVLDDQSRVLRQERSSVAGVTGHA